MHTIPLIATMRGDPDSGYTPENGHVESVAVIDAGGRLLWYAGDPGYLPFTRSAHN